MQSLRNWAFKLLALPIRPLIRQVRQRRQPWRLVSPHDVHSTRPSVDQRPTFDDLLRGLPLVHRGPLRHAESLLCYIKDREHLIISFRFH